MTTLLWILKLFGWYSPCDPAFISVAVQAGDKEVFTLVVVPECKKKGAPADEKPLGTTYITEQIKKRVSVTLHSVQIQAHFHSDIHLHLKVLLKRTDRILDHLKHWTVLKFSDIVEVDVLVLKLEASPHNLVRHSLSHLRIDRDPVDAAHSSDRILCTLVRLETDLVEQEEQEFVP